jgi:hypothetical protein
MSTEPLLLYSRRTTAAGVDDFQMGWEVCHPHASFLTLADGARPPDQIVSSVRALWNDTTLFVLFAGRYVQLRMMAEPEPGALLMKTPRLWVQSDVFEMFLGVGARTARRYFEFQAAPDGRWLDLAVDSTKEVAGDPTWESGLRCRSVVDPIERVWRTILAVPWTVWGGIPTSLEGNFFRASGAFHGDELLSWSPTGYGGPGFHRPERFGGILLSREM